MGSRRQTELKHLRQAMLTSLCIWRVQCRELQAQASERLDDSISVPARMQKAMRKLRKPTLSSSQGITISGDLRHLTPDRGKSSQQLPPRPLRGSIISHHIPSSPQRGHSISHHIPSSNAFLHSKLDHSQQIFRTNRVKNNIFETPIRNL